MDIYLYLICFGVPMLLAMFAQGLLKSRYAAASKVPARYRTRSRTGAAMRRTILVAGPVLPSLHSGRSDFDVV